MYLVCHWAPELTKYFLQSTYPPLPCRVIGRGNFSCYWTQVACPSSLLSKLGWHCYHLLKPGDGLQCDPEVAYSGYESGLSISFISFLWCSMASWTCALLKFWQLTTQKEKLWFIQLNSGSSNNTKLLLASDLIHIPWWQEALIYLMHEFSSLQKHVSFRVKELGWKCNIIISKN